MMGNDAMYGAGGRPSAGIRLGQSQQRNLYDGDDNQNNDQCAC